MNKKIISVIIGNGQVGKAVYDNIISDKIYIYDKGEWEHCQVEFSKEESEIFLHIAIPYNENFIDVVKEAYNVFIPDYVIIHSTIKEGTCFQLKNILETEIVYTPIMGRHEDDFGHNVKNYIKMFACKKDIYEKIKSIFQFNCEYFSNNHNELEYAKAMSTTYMYWCLIYEKEMYNECIAKGYDVGKVYKRFNRIYNKGIENTHPEWKRPIYNHVENKKPGGHCLGPNIDLINNNIGKFIKEWEK